MSPLCVPSFCLISIHVRVLWPKVLSKEGKEGKKAIKMNFCSLASQVWLERFASNLACSVTYLGRIAEVQFG